MIGRSKDRSHNCEPDGRQSITTTVQPEYAVAAAGSVTDAARQRRAGSGKRDMQRIHHPQRSPDAARAVSAGGHVGPDRHHTAIPQAPHECTDVQSGAALYLPRFLVWLK